MRLMSAALLASCAGGAPPMVLPNSAHPDWVAARAEADELEVLELEVDGYVGGEIAATMPASVARVVEVLTDFDHADGKRAWAERHEILSSDGDRVVARWHFKGKLGINPTVDLAFEVAVPAEPRSGGDAVISFRQLEPTFGLAAFFGDHRLWQDPGRADHCVLVSRVFIDSGLPFVGASAEDIAAGLRADVKGVRAWLRDRPEVMSSTR